MGQEEFQDDQERQPLAGSCQDFFRKDGVAGNGQARKPSSAAYHPVTSHGD